MFHLYELLQNLPIVSSPLMLIFTLFGSFILGGKMVEIVLSIFNFAFSEHKTQHE